MLNGFPAELTAELAAKLVSIKKVVVRVSSELVLAKDGQEMAPKVKIVTVKKESDLTPEMILSGPKLWGEVNCYVLCDAFKTYFNAKTGEAIGREMRLPTRRTSQGR